MYLTESSMTEQIDNIGLIKIVRTLFTLLSVLSSRTGRSPFESPITSSNEYTVRISNDNRHYLFSSPKTHDCPYFPE